MKVCDFWASNAKADNDMNSVNKEFCNFCGHFNDLDNETCLYCGADLRPDNKKASEPEKGTNAKGHPWLGILVLAVLICLFIRLL